MFDDIPSIRRARKVYNAKMFASGIGTFRQLEDLEAAALADGALSQKHKELIGLGISIGESCYGWIEYHVGSAADHGATREEILEATAVALALKGAAAQWPARFVFEVLDERERSAGTPPSAE